jgi:putative oxidoreductase
MAKKVVKKKVRPNKKNFLNMVPSAPVDTGCCESKWSLIPLRFALGLMFLAAGLPKLFSLLAGGNEISGFFAGLGIPLPVFAAWLVAIVEVVGGIFLMLGFITWWTGLLLCIVMVVAATLTTLSPFNWGSLTKHLVYIGGLVAVMYGSRYFSLSRKCKCCCRKE